MCCFSVKRRLEFMCCLYVALVASQYLIVVAVSAWDFVALRISVVVLHQASSCSCSYLARI